MLNEGAAVMEVRTGGSGRVRLLEVDREEANAGREVAIGPADAVR